MNSIDNDNKYHSQNSSSTTAVANGGIGMDGHPEVKQVLQEGVRRLLLPEEHDIVDTVDDDTNSGTKLVAEEKRGQEQEKEDHHYPHDEGDFDFEEENQVRLIRDILKHRMSSDSDNLNQSCTSAPSPSSTSHAAYAAAAASADDADDADDGDKKNDPNDQDILAVAAAAAAGITPPALHRFQGRPIMSQPGAFHVVPTTAHQSTSSATTDGSDPSGINSNNSTHSSQYDGDLTDLEIGILGRREQRRRGASASDTDSTTISMGSGRNTALDAFLVQSSSRRGTTRRGRIRPGRAATTTTTTTTTTTAATINSTTENNSQKPILLDPNLVKVLATDSGKDNHGPCRSLSYKWLVTTVLVVIMIVVIVTLAILLGRSQMTSTDTTELSPFDDEDLNHNQQPVQQRIRSTLDRIRQEKVLKCAYSPSPGFLFQDETTGLVSGFDASLCYAIAAALQVTAEFLDANSLPRFGKLANATYDVVACGVTLTMERNVHEQNIHTGIAFSVPYLYTGMQAAGDPTMIQQCADHNFYHIGPVCQDLKVCVQEESTYASLLESMMPFRKTVPVLELEDLYAGLAQGRCNVIVQEPSSLSEENVRAANYTRDYVLGKRLYSKEPLAILTRQDDVEFSDFVNGVVQALILAEALNITQETADDFLLLATGNDEEQHYLEAFRDAIAAVGNYGELYERFLKNLIPRHRMNGIYKSNKATSTGATRGLLNSYPFGNIDPAAQAQQEPDGTDIIELGPTMTSILDRGYIRCAIRLGREGLAMRRPRMMSTSSSNSTVIHEFNYVGMDVDYCLAVASGLFLGQTQGSSTNSMIEFLEVQNTAEGAQLLAEDLVDVVAGATWSMLMDLREPKTGLGFAFSQPYYYGFEDDDRMQTTTTTSYCNCMMTRQEDPQWSSFVYWTVSATIFAEEQNIHSTNSSQMPLVSVFGPDFYRMFRDAILVVGNYGDIYNRNSVINNEQGLPLRQPPNTLNDGEGPQHYPLAWFQR